MFFSISASALGSEHETSSLRLHSEQIRRCGSERQSRQISFIYIAPIHNTSNDHVEGSGPSSLMCRDPTCPHEQALVASLPIQNPTTRPDQMVLLLLFEPFTTSFSETTSCCSRAGNWELPRPVHGPIDDTLPVVSPPTWTGLNAA